MGKRCPKCGTMVEDDDHLFCPWCGSPLNSDLKLMLDLHNMLQNAEQQPQPRRKPPERRRPAYNDHCDDDDDDFDYHLAQPEEKHFPWGVLFTIAAIAAVVYYFIK